MKKYLIIIVIALFCLLTYLGYIYWYRNNSPSSNIHVAVNTVTSNKPNQLVDINQESDLTVDVKEPEEPSKIIEINKESSLTVDADTDYDPDRPVNIDKKSTLTQGGVLEDE